MFDHHEAASDTLDDAGIMQYLGMGSARRPYWQDQEEGSESLDAEDVRKN